MIVWLIYLLKSKPILGCDIFYRAEETEKLIKIIEDWNMNINSLFLVLEIFTADSDEQFNFWNPHYDTKYKSNKYLISKGNTLTKDSKYQLR